MLAVGLLVLLSAAAACRPGGQPGFNSRHFFPHFSHQSCSALATPLGLNIQTKNGKNVTHFVKVSLLLLLLLISVKSLMTFGQL